jgi:Tfp pilus assembly ATPase PilU
MKSFTVTVIMQNGDRLIFNTQATNAATALEHLTDYFPESRKNIIEIAVTQDEDDPLH